jgi:hypothetical protein
MICPLKRAMVSRMKKYETGKRAPYGMGPKQQSRRHHAHEKESESNDKWVLSNVSISTMRSII